MLSQFLSVASLLVSTIPYLSPPPTSGLIINEILYNPDGADDLEFFEIWNRSSKTINLRQFRFRDSGTRLNPVTNQDLLLEPDEYLVVVRDSLLFSRQFPDHKYVQPLSWSTLNNSGDSIVLYDGGVVVDSVTYGADWGGNGVSLERIDPRVPSHLAFNWGNATNGAGMTPGFENSIHAEDIQPPEVGFVLEIGRDSLQVLLTEPVYPDINISHAFSWGGATPKRAEFGTSIDTITLYFEGAERPDYLEIRNLSDWAGNVMNPVSIPVAWQPEFGDLVINEILFDPIADEMDGLPDQPEFVEIWNTSGKLINVSSLEWREPTDESGSFDSLVVTDGPEILHQDEYLLVYSATTLPANMEGDPVSLAFPGASDRRTAGDILIQKSSLGLANSGDTLRLISRSKETIDVVAYSPEWHHSDWIITKGISLERIDSRLDGLEPSNWTSSFDPDGATPGRPNSVQKTKIREEPNSTALSLVPSVILPESGNSDAFCTIRLSFGHDIGLVQFRIFDRFGYHVRLLAENDLSFSEAVAIWDGRDDGGRLVETGVYIVWAEIVNRSSNSIHRYKKPVVVARNL